MQLPLKAGESVWEGIRTGSQNLNIGAAANPDVPGLSKSESCYERGAEGKGLKEDGLLGGGMKTVNGWN